MNEEMKSLVREIFQGRHGKATGFLAGGMVGLAILVFGFFQTIFVLLCGFIGLWIGWKYDGVDHLLSSLQQHLPDRFQHWS